MSETEQHDDARSFETHRRSLTGLAYRMLGSRAEAEDVVQDAYLRWHAADHAAIEQPRHYLGTVVTRLCLDRMKSAQARREVYVGQWLPEPVVDEALDADTAGDLAHDLSVALMLVLERLSPLERASFLLHDVFGLDFAEVGRALGRGEAACRQLAARARAHIEEGRPRFSTSQEEGRRLAAAFNQAAQLGDTATLMKLLAADAVLYSDGGGKRAAALWRGQDPALPCGHHAQEPGAAGHADARRHRERTGGFRDARGGRVARYDGFRASRRSHRRDLCGAQSRQAAPRAVLTSLFPVRGRH